jgi:hypothetical protein
MDCVNTRSMISFAEEVSGISLLDEQSTERVAGVSHLREVYRQ